MVVRCDGAIGRNSSASQSVSSKRWMDHSGGHTLDCEDPASAQTLRKFGAAGLKQRLRVLVGELPPLPLRVHLNYRPC